MSTTLFEELNVALRDAYGYKHTRTIHEFGDAKPIFYNDDMPNINLSSMWSTLIAEAGRWCEDFASDLLLDYDEVCKFLRHVANGTNEECHKEFWFGFRQSGVDHYNFIESRTKPKSSFGYLDWSEYRSCWCIAFDVDHESGKIEATLVRVH